MAELLPSDELLEEPSDYGSRGTPRRLGRYELLVPVARGGMARVWAARLVGQHGFQKLVALKTILPHLAVEPEFQRMFLDEARIASGVHHPNVCEIYELGEEQRTLYLAMEWVSGDSLARVLRASGKTDAIDARVVARIVADACAGVHAAHELIDEDGRALGVVHRDLSPHNILLTADGTAKVADFGVAKALGQLHEATSAGQLKGKVAYMAPEQITGASVDRRSDVFSLGCVIYEATTGQRPFRGEGDHQVMHAVLKGDVPLPSSFVRGYPQELERIVMRALSPQPILRFPTAERMRFALEEFLARGQLVTQANVAQVVRARIGEPIERRKERIRRASSVGDRDEGWSEPPGHTMTPSNQQGGGHRSGVKPSGAHAGGPSLPPAQPDRPPYERGAAAPPMLGVAAGAAAPADSWSAATLRRAEEHGLDPGQEQGRGPLAHGAYGAPMDALPPIPIMPPHQGGPAQRSVPPMQAIQPMHPAAPLSASSFGPAPSGPLSAAQSGPFSSSGGPSPSGPFSSSAGGTAPPGPISSVGPMPAMAPAYPMAPMHASPPGVPPTHGMSPMQGTSPAMGLVSTQPSLEAPTAGPRRANAFDGRPAPGDRPSVPPAGVGQYIAAVAVGVMLAVLIGIGAFLVWRSRQPLTAPRSVATAPAISATSGGGSASSTSAPAVAAVSSEIVFRVAPADAVLSADGQDLAGARALPRPAMGKTVMLVARAPGHDDTTIFIDFFTVSPLDITLRPVAAGATPSIQPAAVSPASDAPASDPSRASAKEPSKVAPKDPPPRREPRRPSTRPDPGLPPNPF